jgi:hypothetical protein
MSKHIKNNLITYIILQSVAIVGIFYGNGIFPNFKFIRVWELHWIFQKKHYDIKL